MNLLFNRPSQAAAPNTILSDILPSNSCGRNVCDQLDRLIGSGANGLLDILAYELNDGPIIRRLIDAARNGVRIRLIVDAGRFQDPLLKHIRDYNRSAVAAPQVRIELKTLRGGRLSRYGCMHQKAFYMQLADGSRTVFFGSFNFTNNAAKYNYENCMVIKHTTENPPVQPVFLPLQTAVNRFRSEFSTLWFNAILPVGIPRPEDFALVPAPVGGGGPA